jgi:hypothetical protein
MTEHKKPLNKKTEWLKNIVVFFLISAVIACVGWALGTFDAGQETEGWIEYIYHSPGESRRPY